MHTPHYSLTIKKITMAAAAIGLAAMLVVAWLATAVNASSIVRVSSNVAQVPNGESFVLTVGAQNDGDVDELEIDHSVTANFPEFSVYADEADPYGGDGALFAAAGVTVTYSAATSQWTIDFGDDVTEDMAAANNGQVTFYLVLKNAAGTALWGSMSPTTPENTFVFNFANGTGESLTPPVTDEPEAVVPGVPNTATAS